MEKKIKVLKCVRCDKHYLPPVNTCSNCEEIFREFSEEEVEGTGKIYSFTVVRVPSKHYKDLAPYLLAIIELEKGLRLIGRVICDDFSKVQIDQPVMLVSSKDRMHSFALIK